MNDSPARWRLRASLVVVFIFFASGAIRAQGLRLAATPPMGWNSWNHFQCRVSDAVIRAQADAMASNGMKAAGYQYVNIDACWQGERDAKGVIHTNKRFPDMKALADYVHSKGLKLGLYSSPGPLTCGPHHLTFEGSYGHEAQDARTYAAWGVDYLKYDWCYAGEVYKMSQMPEAYKKMHLALVAAGRPIVFSLCQYGLLDVWKWGASSGGNLWRTTGDIKDTWASMSRNGFDLQPGLAPDAGPGHWNDPDMLEIGNGGMTETEDRTHMSLWCMLAAPLIAGNDLTRMTPETLAILTNREVIAVDQDRLGREGYPLARYKDGKKFTIHEELPLPRGSNVQLGGGDDQEVWVKPLSAGAMAVALFNRAATPARISVQWQELKIHGTPKVRDLWAHRNLGRLRKGYSAEVPGHGVVMLRVSR
ncbi:MAG TPA: glycoside hydrolase family 27 protein [Terriglobia bacterium]|nr:glycoside hydrolase family 27 protein [Terriglobia bacterium]